jgi:hypothetical protein
VKEGYEWGRFTKERELSFYLFFFERRGFYWMIFWRVLGELAGGEFEFCSQEGSVQGAPVCWGFWARGPVYPYGILELGSCPIW